jgi:hypothetical protein
VIAAAQAAELYDPRDSAAVHRWAWDSAVVISGTRGAVAEGWMRHQDKVAAGYMRLVGVMPEIVRERVARFWEELSR